MSSVLSQKLRLFVIFKFEIWDLFVFCYLEFVVCVLKIRSNKAGIYGESPKLLRSNPWK